MVKWKINNSASSRENGTLFTVTNMTITIRKKRRFVVNKSHRKSIDRLTEIFSIMSDDL